MQVDPHADRGHAAVEVDDDPIDRAMMEAVGAPALAFPGAAMGQSQSGLFLCAATMVAVPYVLLSSVTNFSWFDDEGTLLAFIRSVLDGHRLYDETYSLYGPFYHLVYDFIYGDLGVPLDNLSDRLLAAGFWLAFTACFTAFAVRLTGSLIVGVFSYLTVLTGTAVTLDSAGHPEELALLLLGVLLLSIAAAERRMRVATLVLIGALLAALTLVKINLGAYVGGSVLIVLLRTTIRPGWLRGVLPAAAAGMLLLPVALFSLLFVLPWARSYCLFSTLTILPAILVWIASDPPRIMTRTMWLPLAVGGAGAATAIVGSIVAQGSTAYAVINTVLLQNADYVRNWYIPLGVGTRSLAVAAVAAACGITYVLSLQKRITAEPARTGVGLLKLGVALPGCLAMPLMPAQLLFMLVMPFAWLVIVPPRGVTWPMPIARGASGLIGSAMVLYPFPVAGHQVDLAMVLPLMLMPVLLWDAVCEARMLGWWPWLTVDSGRRLGFIAALAAVAVFAAHTWRAASLYAAEVPLDLPGAAFIRVAPGQADIFRWIAGQLADCPAMFSLPGLYSINVWTRHGLLTPININNILDVISPADQQRVIQALSAQPGLCVVYQPEYLRRFDRGQIAANPPLLQYILGNFAPTAERDGFMIMKRKGT
jgi:hypothetical protein